VSQEPEEPISEVEDLVRKLPALLRPTELVVDDQLVIPSRRQQEVAGKEVSALRQVLASFKVQDGSPSLDLGPLLELEETSETMSATYDRRSTPLTSQTYADCVVRCSPPFLTVGPRADTAWGLPHQTLIKALGFPVIVSTPLKPYEGEALCSSICNAGLAGAVISEDTDVLVYGANLLRNVTTRQKPTCMIKGVRVREELGPFTTPEWIDLALLCGTDFVETVPSYIYFVKSKTRRYPSSYALV
jgi:hypothetical protein